MKPRSKEWATHKVATLSPNSTEKATLMAIAHHSTPDGEGCWAKVETIAKYAGISERSCQRHLRRLEERGELRIEYQARKGSRTNCYFISVCRLTADEREQIPRYAANDTKKEHPIFISRAQMKLPIEQQPELSDLAIDKRSPEVKDEVSRLIRSLEEEVNPRRRGGDPKPIKSMLWDLKTIPKEEENAAAAGSGSGSVESDA